MKNQTTKQLEAVIGRIREYTDEQGLLDAAVSHIEEAISAIQASEPFFISDVQPEETRRSNYIRKFRQNDLNLFMPREYVEKLIETVSPGADFVRKADLWRAYKADCWRKGRMVMERQFMNSAMYEYGYVDYAYNGQPCWWKPGKPKPRPGKRAKNNRTS